jgi:dimethylglycine dehydrogenase
MSTLWPAARWWARRLGRLGLPGRGSIGLGMLRADLAVAGTRSRWRSLVTAMKAVVQADGPAWDAKNERIRA